MPWAWDENAGYSQPCAQGPVLLAQPALGSDPTATPIAAGGNWSSGLLPGDGYKLISVGLQSTQAGQISVQRFLDNMTGQVPQGPAVTQAIVAGTPTVLNVGSDNAPFGTFSVSISNTGGVAATISHFAILLAAS